MDDEEDKNKDEKYIFAGIEFPRLPPALKHGSYSAFAVLPGEDLKQYEELHNRLIKELRPDGPLEENAVKTIAQCVWRINNFSVFARARLARKHYHPDLDFPILCLPSEAKRTLEKIHAREKKHVTPEVFEQVKDLHKRRDRYLQERYTMINVGATLRDKVIEDVLELSEEFGIDVKTMLDTSEVEYELAWLGDVVTLDHLNRELQILKRLEARISRAMKTLMQAKAIKEILGTAPSPSTPSPILDSAPVETKDTAPTPKKGLLAQVRERIPDVTVTVTRTEAPGTAAAEPATNVSGTPPQADPAPVTAAPEGTPRRRLRVRDRIKVPPGNRPGLKKLRSAVRAFEKVESDLEAHYAQRGVEPPCIFDPEDVRRANREFQKRAPPKE